MTVSEAIEMLHQVRAGSIRVENGKLLARLSEAERVRLKPVLEFLRSHQEEVAQLLAEPTTEPAAPALEPASPIAEPTPGTGTNVYPEVQSTPCADPILFEHATDSPCPLTAETNREPAKTEPPPESPIAAAQPPRARATEG